MLATAQAPSNVCVLFVPLHYLQNFSITLTQQLRGPPSYVMCVQRATRPDVGVIFQSGDGTGLQTQFAGKSKIEMEDRHGRSNGG